jgi:hypothetical protein
MLKSKTKKLKYSKYFASDPCFYLQKKANDFAKVRQGDEILRTSANEIIDMNTIVESKGSNNEAALKLASFDLKTVKLSKRMRQKDVEILKKLIILVLFLGLLGASVYLHESQIGRRHANTTSFLTNITADHLNLSNNSFIIYDYHYDN